MTFNHHILGAPFVSWVLFLVMLFYWRLPSFSVTLPEHKHLKNPHSFHLSLLKPTPSGRVRSEAKSVGSRYWESYDVIKFFHHFFSNVNFNKFIIEIMPLNGLCPLAFVSLEKDVSCVSLLGFCVMVTSLTTYGHDWQNWRQPPTEQKWPKTKPRVLRKPNIRQLEVIHSSHFVVKGLLLKSACMHQRNAYN